VTTEEESKQTTEDNAVEADAVADTAAEAQETVESPAAGFPVVGIGASAGGLKAFEAFFSGMPVDANPRMAFVLVQHLAPDHESILADIVRRFTRMQVFEVEEGMAVQPNCAYIIPPGRDMALLHGTLHLLEPAQPRGQRMPIDFFFRSLAEDRHERAIGIVLSGTGSDGTLGVRAIKGENGMIIAQDVQSAEYDGMPRSAVATGLVDYELPPVEMAAKLIAYTAALNETAQAATVPIPNHEDEMKKIFILLRHHTGHDFSQYKTGTTHRRIQRRMAVQQVGEHGLYLKILEQNPAELDALLADLLIGVTKFFRDPEAWKVLEELVIPKLFDGKLASSVIRVWSPGCSTGEEAYSLAMLLAERMAVLRQGYTVQVFATDIDRRAIAVARAGVYPASIAADISPERLARFFSPEPGGVEYRIHKSLRDMLVFSEQDLIKHPPFSKIDLVSCRNLLIYMGAELQKKLIPLFHHVLNPEGMLFLGSSETVGEYRALFATVDRKAKLYRRKRTTQVGPDTSLARFLPLITATEAALPRPAGKTAFPAKLPLRALTEDAVLAEVAPAAALVNGRGDILYLHGRTGMYLELATGEAGINNILKMAREGLRLDLTTALHNAAQTSETQRCRGLRVKTNGDFSTIDLTISKVAVALGISDQAPLYLVLLQQAWPCAHQQAEHGLGGSQGPDGQDAGAKAELMALQKELRAKEEYLRTANEELETTNEELTSANEEMQSVNEELHSTNEELETSKEEMQSLNEELDTINVELKFKMRDLSQANADMTNLLAGTSIAIVFVDRHMRILRHTPDASAIIDLVASDKGRPLSHFAPNLVGYGLLVKDVQVVLDTLIPKELEVQNVSGAWYLMRIHPYRTLENVIEGAVLTFVDISKLVKIRQELLSAANDLRRLATVVRDSHDAVTVQDLSGRTLAWSPGATRLYGFCAVEALQMNVCDRIPEPLREGALATLAQLSRAEILQPYRTQRLTKQGVVVEVSIISTALLDEVGQMYAVATTERRVQSMTDEGGTHDDRHG
jgi:two-component system, chemotaxis family, CheB/CheR fusion protein